MTNINHVKMFENICKYFITGGLINKVIFFPTSWHLIETSEVFSSVLFNQCMIG